MNTVPIAFAFDSNLVMPACVALTSLLLNASNKTFYDIFILYSGLSEADKDPLRQTAARFGNCRLNFKEVGDEFDNAFEIRNITTPTYFRLLIPELIPEYDKIIYADVDIIFRCDLSEVYSTDMKDNYIAGTYDLGMNLGEDGKKYIATMPELQQGEYLQAGFILINSAEIRKDELGKQFKILAKRKLKFQDQDILNIACKKKLVLPWKYNMTDYSFYYIFHHSELLTAKYANSDIDEAKNIGNLHFNGHKPWKKYSVNFDIWWEYYRKTTIYNEEFYYKFFEKKSNVLDTLTLWKRIKTVFRYFTVGMYKS